MLLEAMKITPRVRSVAEGDASAPQAAGGRRGLWVAAAVFVTVLLLVATFAFVLPNLPGAIGKVMSFLAELNSRLSGSLGNSNAIQDFPVYSPLIQNGAANVSFPPQYGTLANYALNLINQDRSNSSLALVTLSPNHAGQQHVDSMLKYGYFSHYDTQGFKPYMRYTLLGGVGAVFENVAYISYSGPHYTTFAAVENDIKLLENSMMYNDSACCNNGHRLNILNPLHNRVSVGIAYNSTTLFFGEDFENYYVNMNVSVSSSGTVTMTGNLLNPSIDTTEAYVAYDGPPTAETPSQLNSGPREYGPGTVIGGVLPKSSCVAYPVGCPTFTGGITVYASSWQFGSSGVNVSFSLSNFITKSGSGVYTVYLVTGSDTNSAITSYSVFIG